jgi:IMP dehydrogenase
MNKCYTYDDVNIIPKYSEVESRKEVSLRTKFTRNTYLDIPIVSSPMDTITESDMSIGMMSMGGVGVIHRFMSIEEQVHNVKNTFQFWESIEPAYDTEDDWLSVPICASIGVTGDYLERGKELALAGCSVLLIDVAHGHHKNVGEAIEEIKKNIQGVEVIAGNIATGEGAYYLCEKGADGIRAGIGNGSLCETRISTGVGIPTVSSLLDITNITDRYGVPVIADGGVRSIGDVCKGLACKADSVMLGSLISGTKETPGSIEKIGEWPNEQLYKKYRGSASIDSKSDRGEDKNVEGNHKVIPYKGKLKRIIHDIEDGIRSSFSYVGANNIEEFHSKADFHIVTNAGIIEAKPHLL